MEGALFVSGADQIHWCIVPQVVVGINFWHTHFLPSHVVYTSAQYFFTLRCSMDTSGTKIIFIK